MARNTHAFRGGDGAHELLAGLLADFSAFLVEAPVGGGEPGEDRARLIGLLDRLALARGACPSAAHPTGPRPPRGGEGSRARVAARFPDLGLYSMVEPVIGELESPVTGDAIDDLVDLADELESVAWYLAEGGPAEAARYYAWSFDVHWGRHLRELQLYLHALGESV